MDTPPPPGNGTMHDFQAAKIRELEEKLASSDRQRKAAVEALGDALSVIKSCGPEDPDDADVGCSLSRAIDRIEAALAAQPSTPETMNPEPNATEPTLIEHALTMQQLAAEVMAASEAEKLNATIRRLESENADLRKAVTSIHADWTRDYAELAALPEGAHMAHLKFCARSRQTC